MPNGRDTGGLFKSVQQQHQTRERHHESDHLLQLQKEIKEEEEQIFADINSFINSSSNGLYFTHDDDHQEQDQDYDSRGCGEDLGPRGLFREKDEKEQVRTADKLCYLKFNASRMNQFNLTSNNQHHNHPSGGNNNSSSNNNSTSHNNLNNNNNFSRGNTENTNPYLLSHKTSELYRHHRQQQLANDSDDLNDYQSHSADDTTINDYQSDSLVPHHMASISATHAINTTDESQCDDRINHHHDSLFQVESNSMIPASRSVADETTQLQDDSQYIQDEPLEELILADKERSSSSSDTGLPKRNNNQQFPLDSEQAAFSEEEQQVDFQSIQAVIQQVQNNLPKPCVFFLEGNCRRSDCKYSHDLSNITCKYWIEGFCFKGELCPFQHSYSLPNDSGLLEANCLSLETTTKQPQLNPTFAIESEADFPSLPFDAPPLNVLNETDSKGSIHANPISTELEHQILCSNSAVVFKTVKKKRKRG